MFFLRPRHIAVTASSRETNLFDQDSSIESLESRLLLAGSLRVTINRAGDVTIRGDGRSNYAEVSREVTDQNGDGDTEDIVVRGTNDPFGNPTTIRVGRDLASQIVLDATDGRIDAKLNVQLGGGHDFIVFRNVIVGNTLNFSPGGGDDSLGFFDSAAEGAVIMRTGGGNDYLNLVNSSFEDSISAVLGSGVDYVGLSGFSLATGALASFNTGGSPDVIYIEDSVVNGDLYANMGSLIDTIYVAEGTTLNGDVTVDMGSLFDLLVLENNVNLNGTLDIDGGSSGFYENQLFLYNNSPYINNIPAGLSNWETNEYTISGVSTSVGLEMTETLSKWIMDLYYSSQPDVNINVVDTFVAANLARGFDYADLPRSDLGPAPNVPALAAEIESFLNDSSFYGYQKLFVRGAFNNEITRFNWYGYTP